MLKDLKIFKILNLIFWLWIGIFSYRLPNESSRVIFFDVGQGDAILIQKGNFEMLVDGGADDTIIYKLGEYMKWNDRLIDIVVITHMHDDHYMGIKYLLERYEVGLFLLSPNCGELCQEFKAYNYIEVSQGMNLEYFDIDIDILWPRVGELDDNFNNDSIVLLLRYLDKRILLMGDAEKEVEEIVSEDYGEYITGVDILKAGHHCSKTASTYQFLELTNPKLSICSCGEDNKFGHPHQETIENFNTLNIPYYITWEEGDYVVE
ncbi:MAG: MBL fold metallo-hydrolase [Candidatus Dojkabacteria bacterium]|nr:MBL fold metallo-hydrolase [Candidatus Dojkabacteria bacterium]